MMVCSTEEFETMTIAEFKKTMTDAFISDEAIKEKYGLADGLNFEDQFSTVSIENILSECG